MDYNLGYQDLVSQIEQNNAYSAEQAQRQMDFQEKVWREQMEYNSLEASKNRDYQAEQAALNREFQQSSADQAMAFSAEQAKADRDWQYYMSSSAHQREMYDLKAAGLNPILAANKGAATSAGAMASGVQAAGSSVNGAQASSVQTPSGAKGETDQQGTYAIMSLLGKMLDNEIARENMANNAEIAENQAQMYTAATRYAAELAQIASIYGTDKSSEASRYHTDKGYESSIYGSDRSAQASMYGADKSSEASRYHSDKSYEASIYGSDRAAESSRYSADRHYQGSIDSALLYTDASRYAADVNAASQAESSSHAIGRLIDLLASAFDAQGLAQTIGEGFGYLEQGGRYALEQNYGLVAKIADGIANFIHPKVPGHWGKTTIYPSGGSHSSGKF